MRLSVIVPLYNEAGLIVEVLQRLGEVELPEHVKHMEIVVVDDVSTDGSFPVAEHYTADKPNFKLVRHAVNQGKGAAVRSGIAASSGTVVLVQDADLELDPRDIPGLLNAMRTLNVPVVNGSRYLPGVLRPSSAYKRYLANKVLSVLTSFFIDVHLSDIACGYKLLTRELYDQLNLKENRFGFEAELIIKCGRMRRNWIAEVPVRYNPRNAGEGKKLRNSDAVRVLGAIFKYGLFRAA